jgi:hypothetical protein
MPGVRWRKNIKGGTKRNFSNIKGSQVMNKNDAIIL